MAAWRECAGAVTGAIPTTTCDACSRETDYVSAISRRTPDLLEEVRGIAAGAGVDPDLLFALQLLDEEWAYRLRAGPRARTLESAAASRSSRPAARPGSARTWTSAATPTATRRCCGSPRTAAARRPGVHRRRHDRR